jgi:hypothetical protein
MIFEGLFFITNVGFGLHTPSHKRPPLVVDTVDTSIASGDGTLVVQPVLENDPYRYKSPLAVGEKITVDGVTVTVLAANEQGDTVQVTIAK